MRFDVMTLFPDIIRASVSSSILGRAENAGLISVNTHNIRDFSGNKHRKVDDTPYGGGMGMLMSPGPIVDCYESFKNTLPKNSRVVYLSPKGSIFNHKKAIELSKYDSLVFLCGHYEGVDERAIELIVDEQISIGDYVLTGGELACCVIIDAVSRLIDGVLSDNVCYQDESIASGLLEYPQYTKPAVYRNLSVPDVLLKGNHKDISSWRRQMSLASTAKHRPDLINETNLTKEDILFLEKLNTYCKE